MSEILRLWLEQMPTIAPFAGIILVLLRVILLIVVAKVVLKVGAIVIANVFENEKTHLRMEACKAKTLASLLKSGLRYVVYFLLAISIIDALGAPTSSIIASAGIVGVAVGFGAQHLVRDVLTGFFLLFEHQFAVGDFIEAFGVSGVVEEVGLRVTKLRDFNGVLHILPNGAITRVSNHSRGHLQALVDVRVSYQEDPERVRKLLNELVAQAAKEIPEIVEGPTVIGIVDLTDSALVFRILARATPLEQWGVERELRRRIKEAFDQEGIASPYSRRVVVD